MVHRLLSVPLAPHDFQEEVNTMKYAAVTVDKGKKMSSALEDVEIIKATNNSNKLVTNAIIPSSLLADLIYTDHIAPKKMSYAPI